MIEFKTVDCSSTVFNSTLTTEVTSMATLEMKPRDITVLGDSYGLTLTGERDTTINRACVGIAWFFVSLVISMYTGPRLVLYFWDNPYAMFSAGMALWFALLGWTVDFFLVNVPKYGALQATNKVGGWLHPFGTGFGFLYPTETHLDSDYINMRMVVIEARTVFLTKDGVPVEFPWTIQFRPMLRLLGFYLLTSVDGISRGLAEIVEAVVSRAILADSIDKIRDPKELNKLERKVLTDISKKHSGTKDTEGNPISLHYGILFSLVRLGPPMLEKSYSTALTGKAIARLINDTAQAFKRDLEVQGDVALESALLIQKDDNIEKKISKTEVGQSITDIAGKVLTTFMAIYRPGADIDYGSTET